MPTQKEHNQNAGKICLPGQIKTALKSIQDASEFAQTIIHCTYTSKAKFVHGGWVNIFATTYLYHVETDGYRYLRHAFNIAVAPDKYYFTQHGQVKRFTLIFPGIPKYWEEFKMIEKVENRTGFIVHDIVRNKSGVYEVDL